MNRRGASMWVPKAEIYAIVRDLAVKGIGVLFVSSELPEILALSD